MWVRALYKIDGWGGMGEYKTISTPSPLGGRCLSD